MSFRIQKRFVQKNFRFPENSQKHDFQQVFAKISQTRFFLENPALSASSPYSASTSCKKTKKSLEPFSSYGGDQPTNHPKRPILQDHPPLACGGPKSGQADFAKDSSKSWFWPYSGKQTFFWTNGFWNLEDIFKAYFH